MKSERKQVSFTFPVQLICSTADRQQMGMVGLVGHLEVAWVNPLKRLGSIKYGTYRRLYRAEKKSLQILLSSTQAGPGRKVKREQEEISRNHVPRLFLGSVVALMQHGSGSRVIAILVIREGTIFRPPN